MQQQAICKCELNYFVVVNNSCADMHAQREISETMGQALVYTIAKQDAERSVTRVAPYKPRGFSSAIYLHDDEWFYESARQRSLIFQSFTRSRVQQLPHALVLSQLLVLLRHGVCRARRLSTRLLLPNNVQTSEFVTR